MCYICFHMFSYRIQNVCAEENSIKGDSERISKIPSLVSVVQLLFYVTAVLLPVTRNNLQLEINGSVITNCS